MITHITFHNASDILRIIHLSLLNTRPYMHNTCVVYYNNIIIIIFQWYRVARDYINIMVTNKIYYSRFSPYRLKIRYFSVRFRVKIIIIVCNNWCYGAAISRVLKYIRCALDRCNDEKKRKTEKLHLR